MLKAASQTNGSGFIGHRSLLGKDALANLCLVVHIIVNLLAAMAWQKDSGGLILLWVVENKNDASCINLYRNELRIRDNN